MNSRLKQDTTIYLIRHAESTSNEHGNVIGVKDALLTEHGRREAYALRSYIGKYGFSPRPRILFSSTMPRAMETADIIAPGLEIEAASIIRDPLLCEIDRGEWDGLPRDKVYDEALIAEMNWFDMDHRAPGGESMHDTAYRGRRWLKSLDRITEETGVTCFAAVSHGITIKSLFPRLFGVHENLAWLFRTHNTGITKIRCTERGWGAEYINATPHLMQPL